MTNTDGRIERLKYVGIAIISLCILMLELTFTRIFSVMMWYHFAFVSISVALFGISLSGLTVFLLEKAFPRERLESQLTFLSALMALSIVVALVAVIKVPFIPVFTLKGVISCGIIYGAITIPFFFGGACISLLLWRHADQVSGLYFSDLLGAALGCILTLVALNYLSGPQVMLLVVVVAGGASACFGSLCEKRLASSLSKAVFALSLGFFILNMIGLFPGMWAVRRPGEEHAGQAGRQILERWNSFSRVSVLEMGGKRVFGWGLSTAFTGREPKQLAIIIDASALTQMVEFGGDLETVNFLKYDITSFAHWLKADAKVLIIGPGGGRDVLAALAFGQKPVTGVEINNLIVDTVENDFSDFVGEIYQHPDVRIHVDEGRSFLARDKERYDIIQASMVDTWAATGSGAFALTENNLYTVEAFVNYLKHLNDDGMLTFSRWYYEQTPGEALRLAALGVEALEKMGFAQPRHSVLLIKKSFWLSEGGPEGVMTMVLKKGKFSPEELSTAKQVCDRMGFKIVCSPNEMGNPIFGKLFVESDRETLYRTYPLNIVPPNDDKPFFFHMARIRDFLSDPVRQGQMQFNIKAVSVLANLFVVMTVLAVCFLVAPLFLFRSLNVREILGQWRHLLYFVLIGFGFIAVEIPLIQRFTLFLGHPIYSLAVVLFSLLLASGIGSYSTRRSAAGDAGSMLTKALLGLVVALFIYLIALPPLIHAMISLPTFVKILITLVLIAPLGWLMGMPFPLGIKIVSQDSQFLIPWCWAVNGAFSVLASVSMIVVAISFGFTAALALGASAYLAVLVMVVLLRIK